MELPKQLIRLYESSFWSTRAYPQGTVLANRNDSTFSVNQGGSGQGFAFLSFPETNMQEAGRIPSGLSFDCRGIACQPLTYAGANTPAGTVQPLIGDDARNVVDNLGLQWKFQNTQLDISTANLIGQGGGLFGMTADTGAADGTSGSRVFINNGNGQIWLYGEGIAMPPGTSVNVQLIWSQFAIAVMGGAQGYQLGIKIFMVGKVQAALPIA